MQSDSVIDIRRLKALYADSGFNKSVFQFFAQRGRTSSETTVERMLQVLQQTGVETGSRKDVLELFRGLEEAHCGEFVIGRRGHSSRFLWRVSLIDVGKVAAGEVAPIGTLTNASERLAIEEEVRTSWLEHAYNLRPDSRVTLSLPADLTKQEAGRLADFVRSLPFDS